MFNGQLKCRRCKVCNGYGCKGQMPGLGGVNNSENFILNCKDWEELRSLAKKNGCLEELLNTKISREKLLCGPVTGAVENIGFENEEDFYEPYLQGCEESGIGVCVGDGAPDLKLELGIKAVKQQQEKHPDFKAAFFLKPYPMSVLEKRVEKIIPYANVIGMDIDAYNIVTMRNKVQLQKQTAESLAAFHALFPFPLAVKGVFTVDDIQLVKALKPEIIYISNHGGRVETDKGSTADFLKRYGQELKNYCQELWVDGGIRSKEDIQTALYYGADRVVTVRPLITAAFDGGKEKVIQTVNTFFV